MRCISLAFTAVSDGTFGGFGNFGTGGGFGGFGNLTGDSWK
ncbi:MULTISPECIES: hypothetical protein [Chitinophaga]|nr:hypothetical protein [Chitinophaga ginsengisegetis]